MKTLFAALLFALLGLGTAHAANCPVPNPNLLGPPFVDNCPLPASVLTNLMSNLNQTLTGKFYSNDSPAANINRLADRVFVGGATAASGNSTASGTWISAGSVGAVPGVYAYLEKYSDFLAYSPNGGTAVFAATHSLNFNGNNVMGLASFVYNDNITNPQTAYGIYSTSLRVSGSGPLQNEVDVGNIGTSVAITPYNGSTISSIGWAIGCGGEASTVTTTTDCSAGLVIGSNTSSFHSGIVLRSGAITGANGSSGTGEGIAMYDGLNVNWYCTANLGAAGAGNTPCATIGSIVDGSVTNTQKLLFTDSDMRLVATTFGSGATNFSMLTGIASQQVNISLSDLSTIHWIIQKDASNNFNIIDQVAGKNAFTVGGANSQVGVGEGAGTNLILNSDSVIDTGLPLTAGAAHFVCVLDSNGVLVRRVAACS